MRSHTRYQIFNRKILKKDHFVLPTSLYELKGNLFHITCYQISKCPLHADSIHLLQFDIYSGPNSDSEKQKRRRKKSSKNSKPALTIGLPTFVNGLQVNVNTSISGNIRILWLLFQFLFSCRLWREATAKESPPTAREPTQCPPPTLDLHPGDPPQVPQPRLLPPRASYHRDNSVWEIDQGKRTSF